MEKINFINNQAPALNADNLNRLQQNIENACEPKKVDNITINENYVYSSDLDITAYKIGKLVIVNVRVLAFKQEVPWNAEIIYGLPRPNFATIFYLTGGNPGNAGTTRLLINGDGTAQIWYLSPGSYGDQSNLQYTGTVIYETLD